METSAPTNLRAAKRTRTLATLLAVLTDAELHDLLALVQTELATRADAASQREAPRGGVRQGG